jgi:hypothetical protein
MGCNARETTNEEINQCISGQVAYNGYAVVWNATGKPGNKRYILDFGVDMEISRLILRKRGQIKICERNKIHFSSKFVKY